MSDGEQPEVLLKREGAVLVVTLNRPDRLNALKRSMERRYLEAIGEADDDPEVGAVVLTGAGRGFCAGVDMGELALIGTEAEDPSIPPEARTAPLRLRKPLIAAITAPPPAWASSTPSTATCASPPPPLA